MGDALSHAVLPGAAIGYLVFGLLLVAMGIAGLAVALLSSAVSRYTPLKEDASFYGFYLGSLALGVMLVSLSGSSIDLLHVLFGSLLAVDNHAILLVLAIIYRPLVHCIFTSLNHLKARIGFADHIMRTFTTHRIAIFVTGLHRPQ